MTGSAAAFGEMIKNAAKLKEKEINDAGGINGRDVLIEGGPFLPVGGGPAEELCLKLMEINKKLKVDNFQKYVELYVGPKLGGAPRIFEKCGERWEVCVAASDDGFQQVSFVNSIATTKGGTHVNHVAEQVVERVLEFIKKKHKGYDDAEVKFLLDDDDEEAPKIEGADQSK